LRRYRFRWSLLRSPLIVVGAVWFLSALGAYVRDLRQLMGVVALMMMYLSPIFFPLAMVPERARPFFLCEPARLRDRVDARGALCRAMAELGRVGDFTR